MGKVWVVFADFGCRIGVHKYSQRNMKTQTIKLDQFLKLKGIASTGGQAKLMIQSGEVKVNGSSETRRGRQLVAGDSVTVAGKRFTVE